MQIYKQKHTWTKGFSPVFINKETNIYTNQFKYITQRSRLITLTHRHEQKLTVILFLFRQNYQKQFLLLIFTPAIV